MHRPFILIFLVWLGLSCGSKGQVGGATEDNFTTGAGKIDLTGAIIETIVESSTVSAGTEARVRCFISKDREELSDIDVVLDTSPNVGELTVENSSVTFVPTVAGRYKVSCRVPGTDLNDEIGAHLTVVPADVVRLDTVLSSIAVVAGGAVDVTCPLYDEFDNRVDITELSPEQGTLFLITDASVTVVADEQFGFSIRGSTTGTHAVACHYGELSDGTPAMLEVLPGDPAVTETFVSSVLVASTEPIDVTCSVFDAYGNELFGYLKDYEVVSVDGSRPDEMGLVKNSNGFTVARAGKYLVYCLVDGFAAGDESPEVVDVTAGLPFAWEVDVVEQDCYWQNVDLPIHYDVVDRLGNHVENQLVDVIVVPDTGVTVRSNGHLQFSEEGDYDVTLLLAGEKDADAELLPVTFNVRVDSTPPIFDFVKPVRGEMLQLGTIEDQLVDVMGSVSDALSPVTTLAVAGQIIEMTEYDGLAHEFHVQKNSRWGMSIVGSFAQDECGNRRDASHSFFRSPFYLDAAVEQDSRASVGTGLLAHLNQMVLDDGNRGLEGEDDGEQSDDLASLAEMVVRGLDFVNMVPVDLLLFPEEANDGEEGLMKVSYECNGVVVTNESAGYWVKRTDSIQFDSPKIEYLNAVDGGIELRIRVDELIVPLEIHAAADLECNGAISETLTGEIRVGSLIVEGRALLSYHDGVPSLRFCDTCLNLDLGDANLDFDWGAFSFMDSTINELVSRLWVSLQDSLETSLVHIISGELESTVLGFWNEIGLEQSFEVPEPIGKTLRFFTGLDFLKFSGDDEGGYAEMGFFTQASPVQRGENIAANAKGAIFRPEAKRPEFSPAYSYGVGIGDNAVNQILWALWYGGGLNIEDLSPMAEDVGEGGIELSLEATMPPVIMPGRNGSEAELGLGNVYIAAQVDVANVINGVEDEGLEPIVVEMYLSTIVGTRLKKAEGTNALIMLFDPNPEVWVDIVDINYSGYQMEITDIFQSLMRLMIPKLLGTSLESIPLPEFDLAHSLGAGQGVQWRLDASSISRNSDYYLLTGSLQ